MISNTEMNISNTVKKRQKILRISKIYITLFYLNISMYDLLFMYILEYVYKLSCYILK